MLPKSPEASAIPRRIEQPPNPRPILRTLTRPRPGGKNHRLSQLWSSRNANLLSIPKRARAAISPPPRPQRRRAAHPRHNLPVHFNPQQRSKRRNPPRKFLRPINRINNQPRPARSTLAVRRDGLSATRPLLLAINIQLDPALRHPLPRHLLNRPIRLRQRRPIHLPLDAQRTIAKELQRHRIRLIRNPPQQRPKLSLVAHHVSIILELSRHTPRHHKKAVGCRTLSF